MAPLGARVPCHRDFHARNWLVRGNDLVGVIDFEHACSGLAARDTVRILGDVGIERPDLARAFSDGHSSHDGPARLEGTTVTALRALDALGHVVMGTAHGDPTLVGRGLATLRRLTHRHACNSNHP